MNRGKAWLVIPLVAVAVVALVVARAIVRPLPPWSHDWKPLGPWL